MDVLSPTLLAVAFGVIAVGGLVTGVNGFGFSVVGTGLLALVLEPQTAVVLMILPMLAANASLARELDRTGLKRCVRRFWPFVAAALVGTIAGMVFLSRVPTRPLQVVLGAFVLVFVLFSQNRFTVPGTSWLRGRCVRGGAGLKAALGLVSGLVFGASNVGVQVVAYLKSLDLDRATFVGVVAMIFLGISGVRVAAAAWLGLYAGGDAVLVSAVAALPGLAGVAVGKRVRPRLPERYQRASMFALLVVIGVRLTTTGLGIG